MPSTYGDAKFKRIDNKWKPGDAYTTCGGLPGFVAGETPADSRNPWRKPHILPALYRHFETIAGVPVRL